MISAGCASTSPPSGPFSTPLAAGRGRSLLGRGLPGVCPSPQPLLPRLPSLEAAAFVSRGAGSSIGPSLTPFVLLVSADGKTRCGGRGRGIGSLWVPPCRRSPHTTLGPSALALSLPSRQPPSSRRGPGTAWRGWRPARHPALRRPRVPRPVHDALWRSEGGLSASLETPAWIPREAPCLRVNPPLKAPAWNNWPGHFLGLRARSERPSLPPQILPQAATLPSGFPAKGEEGSWFLAVRGPTGGTLWGSRLPGWEVGPQLLDVAGREPSQWGDAFLPKATLWAGLLVGSCSPVDVAVEALVPQMQFWA